MFRVESYQFLSKEISISLLALLEICDVIQTHVIGYPLYFFIILKKPHYNSLRDVTLISIAF